uniref:Serine/threonine-protein kinase dclk2 n=1 Tax=Sphaerodactylus townsendi TaxID=933632 RepID=A0ACB8E817_9SAUR
MELLGTTWGTLRTVSRGESTKIPPHCEPSSNVNGMPELSSCLSPEGVNGNKYSGTSTILEKYKVGKVIGDGNFAVVKECIERILCE